MPELCKFQRKEMSVSSEAMKLKMIGRQKGNPFSIGDFRAVLVFLRTYTNRTRFTLAGLNLRGCCVMGDKEEYLNSTYLYHEGQ